MIIGEENNKVLPCQSEESWETEGAKLVFQHRKEEKQERERERERERDVYRRNSISIYQTIQAEKRRERSFEVSKTQIVQFLFS